MTYTHMQKFKVNGQSFSKDKVETTDGQTDRRTNGGDFIISPTLMRSVKINIPDVVLL